MLRQPQSLINLRMFLVSMILGFLAAMSIAQTVPWLPELSRTLLTEKAPPPPPHWPEAWAPPDFRRQYQRGFGVYEHIYMLRVNHGIAYRRFGWPWPAFQVVSGWSHREPYDFEMSVIDTGIRYPSWASPNRTPVISGTDLDRIPVSPLWLGLLANSGVLSLAFGAVGLAINCLRYVFLKGRRLETCPRCNYDIAGLSRCPECGMDRNGVAAQLGS